MTARRSLVWRIYAYSVVFFLIAFFGILALSRLLAQLSYEPALQGPARVAFVEDIGLRLQSDLRHGGITPQESRRIRWMYHPARFQLFPWDKGGFPPALAKRKVVVQPGPFYAPSQDVFWVRLDAPTGPVAAKISLVPPVNLRIGGRLLFIAGTWVLLFVLITVPPLYLWVIKPLRRMVAVAHGLGEGNLQTPVAVDRVDEFGELQQAFETMRERLLAMLETRERLLWDISHELRGPLARMAIALPLARSDCESPYMDQLSRDMSAMDALIGEVLALARGRSPAEPEREPTDLAAIARKLLDERAITLSQRDLTIETQLDPAPLQGDPRLLARAIGNFLDNAIKYTPDPGRLLLETGRDKDAVYFRLRDNGPGIAPEHLARIFEPFYRPDSSRSRETGGTGLGLSIVRAIAERHGGRATLSSTVGVGTTAELRLPVGEAAEQP
ncbi:MAG TPA: HAMP domain-containing sensor histidine kinase [Oscillatoriaceae cyanobacterium]